MASSRWGEGLISPASPPILELSAGSLAADIVAAWYSGNYHTATGLASIGLPGALLWDALNFTKPSGFCGGLTGYWGDAPQT